MALTMMFSGRLVTEDIKPCPFCGGDVLEINDRKMYEDLVKEDGHSMLSIWCKGCNTEVKLYDHPDNVTSDYVTGCEKIIKKWNTRKEKRDGAEENQ